MEANLQTARHVLRQVESMLSQRPEDWVLFLSRAREVISLLDSIDFFSQPTYLHEQTRALRILQTYTFHDSDTGYDQDMADWLLRRWLCVLSLHPENVDVLQGLGHHWLQRAQPSLALIHQEEGSTSSSGTSTDTSPTGFAVRSGTQPFVEARGHLLAAADCYSTAVEAATTQGDLSGELLTSAAEAYMSLGNVSPMPSSERNLVHAVRLLRRAQGTSNYVLPTHLRQYLEDYGRYVA